MDMSAGERSPHAAPEPLGGRLSRRQVLQSAALGAGSLVLAGGLGDLLAACGSSPSPTASGKAITADTRGTLTIWHYSSQQDVKTVQDYTALFTRKYPKIDVKLQY